MSDPQRLLRSGPSALDRTLLEVRACGGPTDEQCASLWEALETRIAAATGDGGGTSAETVDPGHGPRSGTAKGFGTAAKAMAVASAITAGSMTFVAMRSPSAQVAPRAPSASRQPPQSPDPERNSEPAVAPLLERTPPDVSRPASGPSAPMRRPPREPGASSTLAGGTVDRLGEESRLLLGARTALSAGQCERALSHLNEARRWFPAGALVQEREALSIESLACAGRREEASTRASAFLRDFPTSLYADAVRRFER